MRCLNRVVQECLLALDREEWQSVAAAAGSSLEFLISIDGILDECEAGDEGMFAVATAGAPLHYVGSQMNGFRQRGSGGLPEGGCGDAHLQVGISGAHFRQPTHSMT